MIAKNWSILMQKIQFYLKTLQRLYVVLSLWSAKPYSLKWSIRIFKMSKWASRPLANYQSYKESLFLISNTTKTRKNVLKNMNDFQFISRITKFIFNPPICQEYFLNMLTEDRGRPKSDKSSFVDDPEVFDYL